MAAGPTQTTDTALIPEVLADTVRGMFAKKTAIIDSPLVSSGAVAVNGTLANGRAVLGKTVQVPYFGTLGEFEDRSESQSASIVKVGSTRETATVVRGSLAFEVSYSAQNLGTDVNPYEEHARQIMEAARRRMDKQLVTAGHGSALVYDLYSTSTPHYLSYQDIVRAKAQKLGDEQEGIVAMVVHSLVAGDLAAQVDSVGRPLLTQPQDGTVVRIAGIPILVSDSVSLASSDMGAVAGTGTAPPAVTLAVADAGKMGPWSLVIDVVSIAAGAAPGQATFRFSTDGGNTWSATMTTPAHSTATALTDTAVDSLVGNNGETGLTWSIANAEMSADNAYTATALLKCESQIWTRGAAAFWYDQAGLELLTDKDILEHTDIAAMHLYSVAHMYRRRRGGTRPGVVRVCTNASGFIG
jgi:hypothetical protein